MLNTLQLLSVLLMFGCLLGRTGVAPSSDRPTCQPIDIGPTTSRATCCWDFEGLLEARLCEWKPLSVGSVQTNTNTNKQNSDAAKKSSLGVVMAVCVFVCVVDWEGGAIMLDNQSGASVL